MVSRIGSMRHILPYLRFMRVDLTKIYVVTSYRAWVIVSFFGVSRCAAGTPVCRSRRRTLNPFIVLINRYSFPTMNHP